NAWEARSKTMSRDRGSGLVVLIVAAPPDALLVAALGGAVEPLVHAPQAVQSTRTGGIGMVDAAVLKRERAQARPFARVCGHVGSGHHEPNEFCRSLRNAIRRPRAHGESSTEMRLAGRRGCLVRRWATISLPRRPNLMRAILSDQAR